MKNIPRTCIALALVSGSTLSQIGQSPCDWCLADFPPSTLVSPPGSATVVIEGDLETGSYGNGECYIPLGGGPCEDQKECLGEITITVTGEDISGQGLSLEVPLKKSGGSSAPAAGSPAWRNVEGGIDLPIVGNVATGSLEMEAACGKNKHLQLVIPFGGIHVQTLTCGVCGSADDPLQ